MLTHIRHWVLHDIQTRIRQTARWQPPGRDVCPQRGAAKTRILLPVWQCMSLVFGNGS